MFTVPLISIPLCGLKTRQSAFTLNRMNGDSSTISDFRFNNFIFLNATMTPSASSEYLPDHQMQNVLTVGVC